MITSELPLAPIGRIIKNSGAQRVSEDATMALEKVLTEKGTEIAGQAVKLAKYAGRVTVKAADIELAIKELSPGTMSEKTVEKRKSEIKRKTKERRAKINRKAKKMEGEIKEKAKETEGKIKGKLRNYDKKLKSRH